MFDYQTLATEKRTKIVIAAIWIISCLVASSRFFIHDIFTLSELTSFSSLAAIVLTFLVTLYCYGHILSAALLQSGKIAAQERALRDQQTQAIRNRKAAWTVGIVIGLSLIFTTWFMYSYTRIHTHIYIQAYKHTHACIPIPKTHKIEKIVCRIILKRLKVDHPTLSCKNVLS